MGLLTKNNVCYILFSVLVNLYGFNISAAHLGSDEDGDEYVPPQNYFEEQNGGPDALSLAPPGFPFEEEEEEEDPQQNVIYEGSFGVPQRIPQGPNTSYKNEEMGCFWTCMFIIGTLGMYLIIRLMIDDQYEDED